MRHHCGKILIALLIFSVWFYRYLECNAPFLGPAFGAGRGNLVPQRCIEQKKAKQRKQDMKTLEELQAKLAFTCKHEELPPLSEETQQLYHYALYHDLHNMWNGKKGDEVWQNAAVYYRIAAANGDYKANVRLQYLLESGRVFSETPQTEVHNLNKELAKQLPATAYYKLHGYLDTGFGVRTEKDGQFAYLRKAADLGSREAQYVVADLLGRIDDIDTLEFRQNLRKQLLTCASEQGLGIASNYLGIRFKNEKNYEVAVRTFHQGVKNGDSESAFRLFIALEKKIDEGNTVNFLNLSPDLERSKRYETIKKYLSHYDYLQPKVPDLDDIVPLPPAPLPAWDGKIEFQRWYEGASPPKPSDELMKKLAEQAGLDWQTGLPLKK